MNCKLPSAIVIEQAERLLEATVRKIGTDEADVANISCGAHHAGCVAELDRAVFTQMTPDERAAFSDGIPGKSSRVISRIFQAELEGVDLTHAQDCLAFGYITNTDGRFEYFREGILDLADMSSTSSKVGAVLVVGGIAALCLVAPLAAITVGTALLIGTATVSGVAIVKNGIEIAVSDSPESKNDWRDLGNATTGLVAAAAPLPTSIRIFKETWPAVSPALPFGQFSRTSGTLPEFVQRPVAAPAAVELPVAPKSTVPVQTTPTSLYHQGPTEFYAVKIHWKDGNTSNLFWDGVSHELFLPKETALKVPTLVIMTVVQRILRGQRITHVQEISKIEILELNEYAAAKFRAPHPAPTGPGNATPEKTN